jgi:hypothetical protein
LLERWAGLNCFNYIGSLRLTDHQTAGRTRWSSLAIAGHRSSSLIILALILAPILALILGLILKTDSGTDADADPGARPGGKATAVYQRIHWLATPTPALSGV